MGIREVTVSYDENDLHWSQKNNVFGRSLLDVEYEINEAGETVFGGTSNSQASWFRSSGRMGQWMARFFGTKAQPYVAQQGTAGPTPKHPLAGDTVVADDVVKGTGPAQPGIVRQPYLPLMETERKKKYVHYESMDEYPEISAAFDIYADDSTQLTLDKKRWTILSESKLAVDTVEELFETIKLERYYWDIIRNMCKYGDCFIENVIDVDRPTIGIQRIKILNPSFIIRVENEYGYLTDFLQEIPEKNDWATFGWQSNAMGRSKYVVLDKNSITHFRLYSSDPRSYPYGRSIAALAIRIFRSLKLMEDAMLIYRLSRAPERRVFYVNTGNLPANKAEMFVERLKQKFKKEKFFNPQRNEVDERYNPLSMDEDFFVPYRGDKETKIEVLPGAENLGEVDDVKYFRDKLLAAMKIPKDYIVEFDKSPERKANLAQLDVKFAKVITRIQLHAQAGLETIARRHLRIKGFPSSIINNLKIKLPDPSDMFQKRQLDIAEQKGRAVAAVQALGLFSKRHIMKEYYDYTDEEIERILAESEKEQQEEAEQQMAMDPMGGAPMGGDPEVGEGEINQDDSTESGDADSDENIPPTQNPSEAFEYMHSRIIAEESDVTDKLRILSRARQRFKDKDRANLAEKQVL